MNKSAGRRLTEIELEAAQMLGLVLGVDTDDEAEAPVQLVHLVAGDTGHERYSRRPICNATTLWFCADDVQGKDEITCSNCFARLPLFAGRLVRRLRRRADPALMPYVQLFSSIVWRERWMFS